MTDVTPNCSAAVLDQIIEHVNSSTTAEVGGLLVGSTSDGSAVIVGAIPALDAASGSANVTFTHEVWEKVLPIVDRDFPGQSIVGWYHSHPGFGIFLSEYDLFIHRNFFSAPEMVALVIDPLKGEGGWFVHGEHDVELAASFETPTVTSQHMEENADRRAKSKRRSQVFVVSGVVGVLAAVSGYLVGSHRDIVPVNGVPKGTVDSGEVTQLKNQIAQLREHPLTAIPSQASVFPQCTYGYVVHQGDSFWGLSERLLGDGTQWNQLKKLNPTAVEGMVAGSTVQIPAQNCQDITPQGG